MQLIGSTLSPFVRKVRVLAIELGIGEAIELHQVDVFDPKNGLERVNPLRKIPALVTDKGLAIYDSAVICEWLCARHPEPSLLPLDDSRWAVLVTQALADGMVDAAALVRQENLRPAGERSPAFIERKMDTVSCALAALEQDENWRAGDIDLAQIAVGCALGWFSFRLPDVDWRSTCPDISRWYEEFGLRDSMLATRAA